MAKKLEIGIFEKQTMKVTQEHSAKELGSGDLEVFATPAMVAFVENTANNMISGFLEENETTVGTYVEVRHLDSTPVGMDVRCEIELIEIERKKLTFRFYVYDENAEIGIGRHERFIVDKEKFMQKTKEKLNIIVV